VFTLGAEGACRWTQNETSDVTCLVGVLWCFTTMPAHTLPPQRKISSRYLAGNNSIILLTAQT
jgi:hypothetical protein